MHELQRWDDRESRPVRRDRRWLAEPLVLQSAMLFAMPVQLVTRVPDDVAKAVDSLVDLGIFASRSEAVRAGLNAVLERERRRAVGQAIVDGYRRVPQETDDLAWPDEATAAMIAEEPW